MIVYINNIEIPATDILSSFKSEEKLSFDGKFVVASSLDIEIDDIDQSNYNPMYSGSLFYGTSWYDKPVIVYSDDGAVVWKGKAKEIECKPGSIIVRCTDLITELVDQVCVYSSSADVTPAALIYAILLAHGIDADDINYSGFGEADGLQASHSLYCDVTFTKDQGVKCSDVIEELARIGVCSFYQRDGKICLELLKVWDGINGTVIKQKDLIQNSAKFKTDRERIKNDYSIKYNNSGTVTSTTGSDTSSIAAYGTKTLTIPSDSVDSTTPADFRILIRNATGASWVGAQYLALFSDIIYTESFDLDNAKDQWDFLKVGDILSLYYGAYLNEPARITSIKRDDDKATISITTDLVNLPVEVVSRDTTPPDAVEIYGAFPLDSGEVVLKWSASDASDFGGYLIYYTTSPGEWEGEFSNQGASPITIVTPDMGADGYCYTRIAQLRNNSRYYFRVKAYDTSLNESDFSDTVSCIPRASSGENKYCCDGLLYTGLELDVTNAEGGTVPSGFSTYDDGNYDTSTYGYAAIYESMRLTSNTGIESIRVVGQGDAGDIWMQYREYSGGSYGAWSDMVTAIGSQVLDCGCALCVQVRFVFAGSLWSDYDKIYIAEIMEV